MKSSVDEIVFNRDIDFSRDEDDSGFASLARPHQRTHCWTTSHGVYLLPAGESRRPYLGHATTPAPIYGARPTRPAVRPVPLYMKQSQLAGPRSLYCAGAKQRPKTAPPTRGLPHYTTTSQMFYGDATRDFYIKESNKSTMEAAELRRRLTDRMQGADVFRTAENEARGARLKRPSSRERVPSSGHKITWSGDKRYL